MQGASGLPAEERAARSGRPGARSRGDRAFRRARRHSLQVRVLKIALPAAALAIGLGFIGYSYLASSGVEAVDIGSVSFDDGSLVMDAPKLEGFTKDNLRYEMTAARARQALGDSSAIALEEIDAEVPIDAGTRARISAAAGLYDRTANTLDITDGMTLRTTSGIVARLKSASVDIDAGALSTDDPVEIELDGARIAAQSMRVDDGGKVLRFERRVRVDISPGRLELGGGATAGGGTDE